MQKLIPGISFWSLYTLGFTVALPTILYYANDYLVVPPQENATWAFFYLGFGLITWLVILLLYGRFYTKVIFTDKKHLEKTAREGKTIIATITGSRVVKSVRNTVVLDLTLSFTNLAGTAVEFSYQLNDSNPSERRFEIGRTIEMRANMEGKNAVFVPSTMEVARIKGMVFLYSFVFLLLLAAAFVYPIISYQLESNGYGWRFLKITHPWILVPLINLSVVAFIWLIAVFIGKATGIRKQPLRMILYGIRTTGTIIKYDQTGTYINEQPQVRFDIEFTDQQGIKRLVAYKKIVSLLDIHKISTDQKEIMYLPNDPQNIVFYEDLVL
jgi:hypothetical protein